MLTKTKRLIALSCFTLLSGSIALANNAQPWSRKQYSSCINLTSQLEQREKTANITVAKDQLHTKPAKINTSTNYFSKYENKQHTLLLIQTPAAHGLNIKNTKTITRIKLPKYWTNIEHFIINESHLFITAKEKEKSIILIYTIDKTKILPFKTFQISGTIKAIHQAKENLFFLLEKKLEKADLQRLIKQQGESPDLLPTVHTSTSYGLKNQLLDQAQCKKISYNFSNPKQTSFFTLIQLQTNALEQTPKINYFLGNLQEVSFGENYLYFLSSDENKNTTSIARFFRDPKLTLEKTETQTGTLFAANSTMSIWDELNSMLKNRNSHTLNKRKNENLKTIQLQIASNQKENPEFQSVIFWDKSFKLYDPQNQTFQLFSLDNGKSDWKVYNITKDQKAILYIDDASNIAKVQELLSKKANQIKQIWREPKNANLFLLLETKDQKPLLKSYSAANLKAEKPGFKREYSKLKTSYTIKSIEAFPFRTAVEIWDYLDIFLTDQPKQTKVISLQKRK